MNKNYECCICHRPMERSKRLVYQEFNKRKRYGFFRTKANYDICDGCFKLFRLWLVKHKNKNDLKIGVEFNLEKENLYEGTI